MKNYKQVEMAEIQMTIQMQKIANKCIYYRDLYTATAPSQMGKTTSIKMVKVPNNISTYYFTLTKSMRPKRLFSNVVNTITERKTKIQYANDDLFSLIEMAGNIINAKSNNSLIIFDEAGSFGASKLPFLRELYDYVAGKAGILMLGPEDFQQDIDLWIKQRKRGVSELFARSKPLEDLPSKFIYSDVEAICVKNNFNQTKLIDYLYQECRNLKDLHDHIFNLLNGQSGLTALLK